MVLGGFGRGEGEIGGLGGEEREGRRRRRREEGRVGGEEGGRVGGRRRFWWVGRMENWAPLPRVFHNTTS